VVTWEFSCSLVPECCHFRLSSKDGNISATLGKQTDLFNKGPSALPLRIIDDEELTPFHSAAEIQEFLETSRLLDEQFTSLQDLQLISEAEALNTTSTDPFYCLRQTTRGIWRTACRTSMVCHHHSYWSGRRTLCGFHTYVGAVDMWVSCRGGVRCSASLLCRRG